MSDRLKKGQIMDTRWTAKVSYHDGTTDTVGFDEFWELGDWIEAGRDWNEIAGVHITLQRRRPPYLPAERVE